LNLARASLRQSPGAGAVVSGGTRKPAGAGAGVGLTVWVASLLVACGADFTGLERSKNEPVPQAANGNGGGVAAGCEGVAGWDIGVGVTMGSSAASSGRRQHRRTGGIGPR
jgi:hypothetical protein